MSKVTRPSYKRLLQIYDRQHPTRWGADYQPAILATRNEAPSFSRPARIWNRDAGRDYHVLSRPEQHALIFALYHSGVFEIHEQSYLSPGPITHPLFAHPSSNGALYSPLRGTLDVADSLGALDMHPMVAKPRSSSSPGELLPFPWIGDLLLFIKCGHGPPYCVNWSVKLRPEDFVRNAFSRNGKRTERREMLRHQMEHIYYLDGKIPTIRITSSDLDVQVMANLRTAYCWAQLPDALPQRTYNQIVDRFRADQLAEVPLNQTILSVAASSCGDVEQVTRVLYEAIWRRQLRGDLKYPILVNQPLRPENSDLLLEHAEKFAPAAA